MINLKIIRIITNRFKKNWLSLLIFILFGFTLSSMGFELNKESYSSIFRTAASVVATLIGFIGIFAVYKLQNILDIKKHHINRIGTLKTELKIYKNNISIIQYEPDKIDLQLGDIKRIIEVLEIQINSKTTSVDRISDLISDNQILKEIKYILELILENIDLQKEFNPHRDSFLFAIFSIFLFMIPLAFHNVHFLNNNYMIIFDNWRFLKMPFTGLFFGLFFIVLKDLASMLTEFFSEYS